MVCGVVFITCLTGALRVSAKNPVTDAYALKLWTVEDRLPGSPVIGVNQASDGYLWLVTKTQLVRFNGVSFVTISVPEDVLRQTGGFVEPLPELPMTGQ